MQGPAAARCADGWSAACRLTAAVAVQLPLNSLHQSFTGSQATLNTPGHETRAYLGWLES